MNAQPKVLPTPVDWDELYPGRFLKASEFKGKQVTLKIASVKIEELVGDKGPQIKGVIAFEATEKQWALNKTNGICLRDMFGKKVQEWVGKRVTLFPSMWDGEECIRVYGSPDIPADKVVAIALPRKRPFNMTMHRTQVRSATAKSASTQPPAPEQAIAQLRAPETLEAFDEAKKTLWALYAGAGVGIPLEVEDAANMRREALTSEEATL